ncbi:crgA protein [Phycomyces blakesleeanus]
MQASILTLTLTLDELRSNLESEMECIICCNQFSQPATTSCGHTFCHGCLVRSLDHQRACPVCREPIASAPPVTKILCDWVSLLYSDTSHEDVLMEDDSNLIPILAGALAFPHNRCVIHIFEPRYKLMLRRIMDSQRRRFAMCLSRRRKPNVSSATQAPFFEYGTMLELTHVQTLPDGRSVVEAIGSHRFRVLSHELVDGYHVGKVERVDDIDAEQEQAKERRQIMTAGAMRARQQRETQLKQQREAQLLQQQQLQQQMQEHQASLQQPQPEQPQPLPQSQAPIQPTAPRTPQPYRPNIPQQQRPMPFSPMGRPAPRTTVAPPSVGAARPYSPIARPGLPNSRTPLHHPQHQHSSVSASASAAASAAAPIVRPTVSAMGIGQRQSWASRAHPQIQTTSKAPWLQMHLQGVTAAQPKPQRVTPTLVVVPAAISTKSKEEETTEDLLDQLASFVESLLEHQRSTPNDRFSQWLAALGDPPVGRGPNRDRVVFTWWVANMMPLDEEEKSKLLAMTSVRERVLTITEWIDKFKDQWTMRLSKDQSSMAGTGQASCAIS